MISKLQQQKKQMSRFAMSEEYRREELVRTIERTVESLTLVELEALHYDMITKNYIKSI